MSSTPGSREDLSGLVQRVLTAEPRAVGRAISRVLCGGTGGERLRDLLRPHVGGACRVGVTGPPGVGKSTLVAAMARELVRQGERVAVVASDPSSPVTGGAFLGDRVRLAGFRLSDDPSVFFRSLSRRESGGVGIEASRAADVLDAAGYTWIFLETVGAGQADWGIRDLVDTVIVLVSPELGDGIQLLKAGMLEIADIFVVNRADRPGAEKVARRLAERSRASLRRESGWTVPVLLTRATRAHGIPELVAAVSAHRERLEGTDSPRGV